MKKIEIELFKFGELEPKFQKKLIDEEVQNQYEFFCETSLYDELKDEAYSLLKFHFKDISNLKLLYNLDYSQGSGLICEFDFTFKGEDIEVRQNPHNHFYTFTSNFTLNYDEFYSNLTADEVKTIKEDIIKVNEKLKKLGYELLEDRDSFENQAKEYLNELEESFTKDGKYYSY